MTRRGEAFLKRGSKSGGAALFLKRGSKNRGFGRGLQQEHSLCPDPLNYKIIRVYFYFPIIVHTKDRL